MESWQTESSTTTSPHVKFETSPAESFMSTPGDMYPSLFASSDSMNPLDTVMTPQSFEDDHDETGTPASSGDAENSEKKQTKKRKSWGQVLPEPKTNLPPRKRAKTEDEKEQRRVERVLRNRRAAQSSRERKRLEVEALMERNKALEDALMRQQKTNFMLMEELSKFRRDSGVAARGSSPLDPLQPTPLTLSQPLFGSQQVSEQTKAGMMDDFILMPESKQTINPASLSPELAPVPDHVPETSAAAAPVTASNTAKTTSSDVTQHPAAMLCDLQCQSAEVPRPWMESQQRLQPALALYLQLQMLLLSACQRPLTLVALALRANLTLQPTPSILNTIIWLVTLPRHRSSPSSSTSTTTTSSATTLAAQLQARPRESPATTRSPWTRPSRLSASSTTLRLKSLRKLLTCSPILARPLMDATMELLRLVSDSEGRDVDQVADERRGAGSSQTSDDREGRRGQPQKWLGGASLPSREVLLTLLWAIRVEERKIRSKEQVNNSDSLTSSERLGDNVPTTTPNQNIVLMSVKRRRDVNGDDTGGKRVRFGHWGRDLGSENGWR